MTSGSTIRKTAFVDNVCCECGNSYSTPSSLLKHMMKVHQIQLHPRMQSKSRPPSTKYEFVKVKTSLHQRTLFGCPSCWFYCPQDLERLSKHIRGTHLIDLEDGYETPVDEEDDEPSKIIYRDPVAEKEILQKIADITNSFKELFSTK